MAGSTLPGVAQGDMGRAAVPGIPGPIVALNRSLIVVTVLVGLLTGQAWLTTALLVVLAGAVAFGPKGSLVYQVGSRLLARPVAMARDRGDTEAPELMRFNNAIAVTLLGLAQVAFLVGWPVAGWALATTVAVAATVALAGFCLGCYVFVRFRLARYRLGAGRG